MGRKCWKCSLSLERQVSLHLTASSIIQLSSFRFFVMKVRLGALLSRSANHLQTSERICFAKNAFNSFNAFNALIQNSNHCPRRKAQFLQVFYCFSFVSTFTSFRFVSFKCCFHWQIVASSSHWRMKIDRSHKWADLSRSRPLWTHSRLPLLPHRSTRSRLIPAFIFILLLFDFIFLYFYSLQRFSLIVKSYVMSETLFLSHQLANK